MGNALRSAGRWLFQKLLIGVLAVLLVGGWAVACLYTRDLYGKDKR